MGAGSPGRPFASKGWPPAPWLPEVKEQILTSELSVASSCWVPPAFPVGDGRSQKAKVSRTRHGGDSQHPRWGCAPSTLLLLLRGEGVQLPASFSAPEGSPLELLCEARCIST